MKVILMNHIEKVGKKGDVVNVRRGFARNYLVPRELAIYATPQNMKRLGSIQAKAAEEEERIVAELKKLDAKIRKLSLVFVRKVDENDHMFGSVSETDISAALQEQGIEVHKSQIIMEKHIKSLGESSVPVRLHRDVLSEVQVTVEKEQKEAEQAAAEPEAITEPAPQADEEPAAEELDDDI